MTISDVSQRLHRYQRQSPRYKIQVPFSSRVPVAENKNIPRNQSPDKILNMDFMILNGNLGSGS